MYKITVSGTHSDALHRTTLWRVGNVAPEFLSTRKIVLTLKGDFFSILPPSSPPPLFLTGDATMCLKYVAR